MRRRDVIVSAGAATFMAAGAAWALSGPDYAKRSERLRAPRSPNGPRDLNYLVHYATLAANGHNSQPWRFSLTGNRISILPDLSRTTPVVDPDNHHLYASLGCAAENLMLAAEASGSAPSLNFHTAGDGAIQIDLAPASAATSPVFQAIPRRQSTKSVYDGRPASLAVLRTLEAAAKIDGCRAILISDKPGMEHVLDLIVAANAKQVGNPAFVKELQQWLRFNAASAVEKVDGLYSGCSGNPSLPSWMGNVVFPRVFTVEAESEKCIAQVRSSSGLAIWHYPEGRFVYGIFKVRNVQYDL